MSEQTIQFVAPNLIPAYLKCTICKGVMQIPSVIKCGHCFCEKCIIEWSQPNGAKCPICKAKYNTAKLAPHLIAKSIISELKVHCNSCAWIGSIKELAKHQNECKNQSKVMLPKWVQMIGAEYSQGDESTGPVVKSDDLLARVMKKKGSNVLKNLEHVFMKKSMASESLNLDEDLYK